MNELYCMTKQKPTCFNPNFVYLCLVSVWNCTVIFMIHVVSLCTILLLLLLINFQVQWKELNEKT